AKVNLEPGDAFFLYTDGIYGAGHDQNPRLSGGRLAEMLHPLNGDAQALLNRVVDQAMMTDGGKPAADDVAAVAVRREN
ncbi:MAG: serine/threonine-protein phosphatase, partial [Verrucomicrobiota bacterium]|nr:serine/threonine-protein phosphatase [Verrucomicrobiota bacterium]